MYEPKHQAIARRRVFIARVLNHGVVAIMFVFLSLLAGIYGYHELESLNWVDSFLNASMILGGMGPVNELKTESGKIFAGIYALYSGLVFLVSAGLIFSPLVHRMLHRFHAVDDEI